MWSIGKQGTEPGFHDPRSKPDRMGFVPARFQRIEDEKAKRSRQKKAENSHCR